MFSHIIAAFSFFTRLPFWRLKTLTKEDYEHVVPFWPIAGWLTAASMILTFWLSSLIFPIALSVIFAFAVRLFVTGALHEDGFADFFDGFGGGHDKDSTLRIMKDSHIGTYGVVALIIYILLWSVTLHAYFTTLEQILPSGCFSVSHRLWTQNLQMSLIFFAADPFSKWASSNIINILPYARTQQEAKNKLVYNKMSFAESVVGLLCGCIPALICFNWKIIFPMIASAMASSIVIFLCYKKLRAYTGDCCGACFLISELAFYVTALALLNPVG